MDIKDFKGPRKCFITEETRHALTMRILEDEQELIDEMVKRGVDVKVAKKYVSGKIVELK